MTPRIGTHPQSLSVITSTHRPRIANFYVFCLSQWSLDLCTWSPRDKIWGKLLYIGVIRSQSITKAILKEISIEKKGKQDQVLRNSIFYRLVEKYELVKESESEKTGRVWFQK